MVIANGGLIYVDYFSHHMPVTYFLTALYKVLGAQTTMHFRLLFYLTLSICFVFLVNRYKKALNYDLLYIYPILYITQFPWISTFAHMILAEHIQAIALAIIFLEFLLFSKTARLSISNFLIISICSFLAVGVAAVSVFPILILIVGFIILGISNNILMGHGFLKSVFLFVRKNIIGVPILLAPFVTFVIYLILTGSMSSFIEQAYYFNREVYSQFTGEYGGSISQTLYPMLNYQGAYLTEAIHTIQQQTINSIIGIMLLSFSALIIGKFFQRSVVVGLFTYLFLVFVSPRGLVEFHSLPYWSASCLLATIAIQLFRNETFNKTSLVRGLTISCAVLILLSSYMSQLSGILPMKKDFKEALLSPNTTEYYVDLLLDPSDKFATTSVFAWYYVETGRLPATRAFGMLPWYAEWYEDDFIQDLNLNRPKVIIHSPTYSIWGYVLKDYAPTLVTYISDNYTNEGMPAGDLWVRKDFREEAIDLLTNQSN